MEETLPDAPPATDLESPRLPMELVRNIVFLALDGAFRLHLDGTAGLVARPRAAAAAAGCTTREQLRAYFRRLYRDVLALRVAFYHTDDRWLPWNVDILVTFKALWDTAPGPTPPVYWGNSKHRRREDEHFDEVVTALGKERALDGLEDRETSEDAAHWCLVAVLVREAEEAIPALYMACKPGRRGGDAEAERWRHATHRPYGKDMPMEERVTHIIQRAKEVDAKHGTETVNHPYGFWENNWGAHPSGGGGADHTNLFALASEVGLLSNEQLALLPPEFREPLKRVVVVGGEVRPREWLVQHLVRIGGNDMSKTKRLGRADVKRQVLQLGPLKVARHESRARVHRLQPRPVVATAAAPAVPAAAVAVAAAPPPPQPPQPQQQQQIIQMLRQVARQQQVQQQQIALLHQHHQQQQQQQAGH